MKKINILIFCVLASVSSVCAGRKTVAPVGLDSISFERDGSCLTLGMQLNLLPTDVSSCNAMVMTPIVVTTNGDSLLMPSVSIYGRQRYINYLRSNGDNRLKEGDKVFKASEKPDSYNYHASLPYSEKLDGCLLLMRRQLYGCAGVIDDEKINAISQYAEMTPPERELVYIDAIDYGPVTDTISGKAFIDFMVNKTDIDPSYRRNPQELLKIQNSIDTVINDNDVRITKVLLKGFASPEGQYDHNAELALGRTMSLKHHLNQLYNFAAGIIATSYQPEDWEGLRNLVAKSNIDHKTEILEIIDSDLEPDPKEKLIAKRYPREYDFIYHNFYPGLRHTEYQVIYEVKRFDDINKIREVMHTKPGRLTLREFYLLGNASIPGSDEFNEVYETAVRMYPNDPVANINAANAALQRNDLVSAEKYLAKAGDSDEAVFARATLAFAKEDYDNAEQLLTTLPDMATAQKLLNQIYMIKTNKTNKANSIMLE